MRLKSTYKSSNFRPPKRPENIAILCPKFTGKEKDSETGYYYFGARYYNSDLSLWLSVDPMADKYPSLSPYNYCAWNPLKIVDPDGSKIYVWDNTSQGFVKKYMTDLFGRNDIFNISKNGRMEINKTEYRKFYKNASSDQRHILDGLSEAIKSREKVSIKVRKDNSKFRWHGTTDLDIIDKSATFDIGSGVTSTESYPLFGYLIGINDKMEPDSFSAGYDNNGNAVTVQPPACTTFIHEVLDEFLNFNVKGKTDEKSPGVDKVEYQNTALRMLGLPERDGVDHNY